MGHRSIHLNAIAYLEKPMREGQVHGVEFEEAVGFGIALPSRTRASDHGAHARVTTPSMSSKNVHE
jgi:hypothetical protein